MASPTLRLIYVFDPLCGWCYGFSPAMQAFHADHPDVPLEVLSGGLFTGGRVAPLSAYPFIARANVQVSARSGVLFGPGFDALLRQGTCLLDSQAAAAGFAALRAQAPEQALALAAAVQRAFYIDGRDLNDPSVYVETARAHGLDAQAVGACLAGPQAAALAQADFARARRL